MLLTKSMKHRTTSEQYNIRKTVEATVHQQTVEATVQKHSKASTMASTFGRTRTQTLGQTSMEQSRGSHETWWQSFNRSCAGKGSGLKEQIAKCNQHKLS